MQISKTSNYITEKSCGLHWQSNGLRPHASNTGGQGANLIPGQGNKIPHAARPG